jgi:hypothetical protein
MPRPWREGEIVCIDTSLCENYRYSLEVRWGKPGKLVAIVGLNPSTACLKKDDHTLRKCINWASKKGYVGLLMLNAYAFRDTKPGKMKAADNPFGEQTADEIVKLCGGRFVVAAWGTHAQHRDRGTELATAFARAGVQLECWGINKTDESPTQPTYISLGNTEPWPRKPKTTS